MKSFLVALCVAIAGASLGLTAPSAEAKRLGGGRPAGMQRQMPPAQPAATPHPQPAPGQTAAAPTPAAPAAAPGKRSWMGPIAGLAAGLGLAALMSHLGMGEAFGNFLTMALLAMLALFAVRWFMKRRSSGGRPAMQGAGWQFNTAAVGAGPGGAGDGPSAGRPGVALPPLQPLLRTGMTSAAPATWQNPGAPSAQLALPAGVDAAGFERLAKMVFIRLQAANDAGAVDDLRKFTTPELFASLRLDLQERGKAEQQTDVVELDARLVDAVQEAEQWVASVQFRGLIREERGSEPVPFSELWHLVKPVAGDRDWAIAGITPQG